MKALQENGLTIDRFSISVDYGLWTTQAILAKKLKVTRNALNNRVRRAEAAGLIETYYIEQLGIRLVPNIHNINELSTVRKKQ